MWLLLWPCRGMLGYPPECRDRTDTSRRCTNIPADKLLERATQHAELIYQVSEESHILFEEMFIPLSMRSQHLQRGQECNINSISIPGSKVEAESISDEWLLHTVLALIRSWMGPLLGLEASLGQYDNAPAVLLESTHWLAGRLRSLEQGVVVLMGKMLNEDAVVADPVPPAGWMPADLPQAPLESVIRDYILLTCFRKDVHKVETFLKLLRCRRTDSAACVAVRRANSP
ncbi:LOW QUALITY PROTEIN: somatolactin-like [Brienomyrus brachyistius]|uniref:LOW QUALITY PROTEIN: somatolactin-like n=1 Tax=Brienomyrus brachyistius TaxID=42636 RepID=UPI0020B226D1|nr:LOW QUALITY PROTEIN: somatolactin-like [Brienomyrus brachyistius]